MKKQVDVWEWDELIALLPDAALEDVAKSNTVDALLDAFKKALLTELRPKKTVQASHVVAFLTGAFSVLALGLAYAVGQALSSGVPL